MIPLVFVTTILICSARACFAQPELAFQDGGPDWAEQYTYLPQEHFSIKAIEGQVQENLRELRSHRLAKLVIASDRQDLLNLRRGKGMADYSYAAWASVFTERVRARQPLAMALKIGDRVAFMYRDAMGVSTEHVLGTKDAFVVRGRHQTARIVHITFTRVPYGWDGLVFTLFFLEYPGNLSESVAMDLAKSLRTATGVLERMIVVVRRDAWFIDSEEFPIFSPFATPSKPVTLDEYLRTPTIVCGSRGDTITCRKQNYTLGYSR